MQRRRFGEYVLVSQNAFVLGTNAKLNGFVGNVSAYYERMFR